MLFARSHTITPSHRTRSFISHLNSPGSIRLGCHFRSTELLKHTSLHCPTKYTLTPGSREWTCEQSALPRSTTSEHIQRSRGSNPQSLACTSRTLPLSHDAPRGSIFLLRGHMHHFVFLPFHLSGECIAPQNPCARHVVHLFAPILIFPETHMTLHFSHEQSKPTLGIRREL